VEGLGRCSAAQIWAHLGSIWATEIDVVVVALLSARSWQRRWSARSSVIRLKRIYNFLCSMLIYAPFALCFVTLRDVFTHFPELTY
jgi:hypothetical protein